MSPLYDHIVVPLDFTQKNEAALESALRLAKQNGARVTLMHVIETIDYGDDGATKTFYESLEQRAEHQLSQRAQAFMAANVPVDQQVITGKTAWSIVDFASDEQADLVVLSSHKVDLKEAPTSWATLSYQVSILCQCPVMLVK